MVEDLNSIAAFVTRLARRERWMLLGQVSLQVLSVGLLALLVALVAAAFRWDRSGAAASLTLAVGAGLWAFAWVPLLRRWRQAGDKLRQARLVEGIVSDLQGRLVTSVEHVDGVTGAESPALLGLVARRAVNGVRGIAPSQVHSTRPLVWRSALVFGLTGMTGRASIGVRGGAGGAWQFWMGGIGIDSAAAAVDLDGSGPRSRVGDIVLEYIYPEYTGLEPSVVPNSTGVVHAPPGTRVKVSAKVGREADAASLVAYDEPPLDAGLTERRLEGELTVRLDPGSWNFVVYRGGEAYPSDQFAIEPEPDLPPEVTLDLATDRIEVAVDEVIALGWRALDDYGIRKVEIEVDGRPAGAPLARPETRKAELFDTKGVTPRELGLQKGARVDLTVAAWDNDAWSGSKAGRSRSIELVVLGARGLDQRQLRRESELIEHMLAILADHLEEAYPPGRRSSGDFASWGEEVAERHGPLDDAIAEWGGIEVLGGLSAQAARMVRRSARELIRFSQVAFTPGLREAPLPESVSELGRMREEHVATVEQAVLMLDQVVQGRLLQQLTDLADELDGTAQNLRDMAERGADPLEMVARLDRLEEQLRRISELSAQLKRGPLRSFMNQRQSEMSLLMQEVREALARGENEEAAELMSRLAEQIEQLSQSIKDRMSAQSQQDQDTLAEARDVVEEMKQLESEQESLQEQVAQLREQGDKEGSEKAAALWEELEKASAELTRRSQGYEDGLREASRSLNEQERAGAATDESERLEQSARARDLRGASRGVGDIGEAWYRVSRSRELAERMSAGSLRGPGRAEERLIGRQLEKVEEIVRKLEELSKQSNPAVERQARQLEQQQQALEQRLEELGEQAEQIGQQMPIQPRGMSEALGEAQQRMQSAGQELGQGRPMQAEGEQGMAGERVRDARRALEESIQQSQQIPGPGGGEDPERQEGEGGEEGQDSRDSGNAREGDNSVDIPSPEDFRTPEEYRRMLLEGMEGDVPEEFRALKKRYFEELVNQ